MESSSWQKATCPYCGAEVYTLTIEGKMYGYYEEAKQTPLDKRLTKGVGVYCCSRATHGCCNEVKEIVPKDEDAQIAENMKDVWRHQANHAH